jgi:tetratricopeptide (TPR) repeat protein
MSLPNLTIEPLLSTAERAELAHLDYLLERMKELLERQLIGPESYATVVAESRDRREAIERRGGSQAAAVRARSMAKNAPRDALAWAERALELDPSRAEVWELVVDLSWSLEQDEQAIARCTEAVGRFPKFQARLDRLRSEQVPRAEARRRRAEEAQQERDVAAWLAQARIALKDHQDAESIVLCQQVLAVRPDHIGALSTAAYAYQRLGQLDGAVDLYEALAGLQPSNPIWSQWVRNLRLRMGVQRLTGMSPETAGSVDATGLVTSDTIGSEVVEPPPRLSWSSFAGEFLEEHWQKLILCLAVLLIVVSSTVGAHLLLGPLLWSPVGKCALALVWTAMFAALGAGLVRWGAERAGQMMLVTTLIVVPIHFMLAGELKLLTEPSVSRLVVMAIDALALVGLVRGVSGMLVPRAEARFLTIALLLLSVGSAVTARGAQVDWGSQLAALHPPALWQFAAFQAPALVFLGAVWVLGARQWGTSSDQHRRFATLMLGLLGFALLACLIRTGVYALQLKPALYAVPVMVIAIACVHAARRLAPHEPDPQSLALLRFGGYVLSGLSFALALASPLVHSPLYSGNTLAVGLLGFGLYAASLWVTRLPAFLYLALGALAAARLGMHYFIVARLLALIHLLAQALGYPESLPWPFLSVLGLVLNPALVLLSLWFRRHWNDDRLARHCHYLGLPLAIAACVSSGFEPLAATICLSGYTVLYLLAVWVFAKPWLTYPAIAAMTGAAYFGSSLVAGVTRADQALLFAGIALGCWGVRVLLEWLRVDEAFRVPWLEGVQVLATVAMLMATLAIASLGPNSVTAAGAFVLVAVLAVLLNRERPWTAWAYLALVSFLEFTICALGVMTGGAKLPASNFGLLFMGDGLAGLAVAEALRARLRQTMSLGQATSEDSGTDSRPFESFLSSIPRVVIALTIIADWAAFGDLGLTVHVGLVFLLGSATLTWTTRFVRRESLVYLGLAQFAAGVLALSSWSIGWSHSGLAVGWLAVTSSLIALSFWLAAVLGRRFGLSDFYAQPCSVASLLLTLGVFVLAVGSRLMALEAYRLGVVALVLDAIVTMLLAWMWRRSELTYAAVFHFVAATYLVLFSVGKNDPAMAYVLGLCAAIEALLLWGIGLMCQRLRDDWARRCARPLFHSAIALTGLGILLADHSSMTMMLVAISFLLAVKGLPHVAWLYAAVAALGTTSYLRWFADLAPSGVIAFETVAAFGLWATGVLVQRFKPVLCARLGLPPLDYEYPLFHSSVIVALLALWLRVALSVRVGVPWGAYGWFPISLSLLALVMLRAYPRREWVHASLAFLSWAIVVAVAPSLTSFCFLNLAGMVMALVFLLIDRVVLAFGPGVSSRLGIIDAGYARVVRQWETTLFGLATILALVIVIGEMSSAILGPGLPVLASSPVDWWALLATLGLFGLFLVLEGLGPGGQGAMEPDSVLIGLQGVGIVVLWWLGVASSPLMMVHGLTAADYYPLVTAVAALGTVHFRQRYTQVESWHELGWLGDLRSERLGRALSHQTWVLAVLAVFFTKGVVEAKSVVTLVMAAVALGLTALSSGWPAAAFGGGLAWTGAWALAGMVASLRLGFSSNEWQATSAAVGAVLASFSLWALSGGLRRAGSAPKSPDLMVSSDWEQHASRRSRLAWAIESAAFGVSLLAAVVVLLVGTNPAAVGGWGTIGGIGVLMATALLQIVLVPRWEAEWLVYLAQACMLGAYLDFRMAYPLPIASDAAILTLLGYLDLALADVLDRLRVGIFARPTRYFSFVLPVLPLIQLVWSGGLDEVSLFHLFAAGTFYGVACAELRWKWLGYAAAVLYNAALWVLWSRLGWMLADHPQFFLVPVGLSAILFAEVNRAELGRTTVNTIRSVGLILIYVSLAVPIWQFASFGAWLTLLLGSLAGVFIGIGLRLQTFLWLGLATFVLDVVYEMGRVSLDYAFAKWAIMLTLGIALVLFVALNEKKGLVAAMRDYYDQVRLWE